MFELGPEKLLMLLLICLVLFGGKRIPEIGGSIGKGIREFKRGISEIGEDVKTQSPSPSPATTTSVATAHDDVADIRPEPKRLT